MQSLHSIILAFIGDYVPIISTLSDGSEIVSADWSWILSCVLFILVIWSVFRLLGGFICNR